MHRVVVALAVSIACLMGTSAHAAEASCGADLSTLQEQETALDVLETAHEEGAKHREALRVEADTLGQRIRAMRAEGDEPGEINVVVLQRTKTLADLARSQRVGKAVATQIAVMREQVEDASREYLRCVEATL